jgi:ribonuclease T2
MNLSSRSFASLRLCARPLLAVLLLTSPLVKADPPGQFDYYVLSLSWSPQYCATSRHDDGEQCARPYAFVVHGLWPQNQRGYPQDCPGNGRVSEDTITQMLPLMPSRGLVIHEWRTHGACSGLDADAYFGLISRAYRGVRIPADYREPDHYLSVAPEKLKSDFVAANAALRNEDLAVECSGHYLREVRVCLSKDLAPRACGSDVDDRCEGNAVLRPVR